jgi:hypothetical protein
VCLLFPKKNDYNKHVGTIDMPQNSYKIKHELEEEKHHGLEHYFGPNNFIITNFAYWLYSEMTKPIEKNL